jgi:hypothetical protein
MTLSIINLKHLTFSIIGAVFASSMLLAAAVGPVQVI